MFNPIAFSKSKSEFKKFEMLVSLAEAPFGRIVVLGKIVPGNDVAPDTNSTLGIF